MKFLQKVSEMLNSKKEETEGRIYILDTCALHSSESMQIIKEASKVIILTGTIKELDDHKNDGGSFGDNVRSISKASRIDQNGEKYECVAGYEKRTTDEKYQCIDGYEKYKYQDENIIDYCRKRKNRKVIILTCDNNLCNNAKAYRIPYYFPKRDDDKVKKKNRSERDKSIASENTSNISIKKNYANTEIKDIKYMNGELYSIESNSPNTNFIIRSGKVINNNLNNGIKLEIGDSIFSVKSKNEKVVIVKCIIDEIQPSSYAHQVNNFTVEDITSLQKENLPKEVEEKVKDLLTREEEKTISKEKNTESEQQEIIFEKRWIRAQNSNKYINYINVERQGKLIKTQDYAVGDFIYLSKYNKKQNSLKINVYKIGRQNNQYVAEKHDEYKLWLVNEIYNINLSEELQDKIRSFFVKHARY